MTSFALVGAAFFLAKCLANFDGQVTSIMSWINMIDTTITVGTNPGEYTAVIGNPSDITANGVITNSDTTPLALVSNQIFPISADAGVETHFQYSLKFRSLKTNADPVGPLGSNEDPMYGCLQAGVLEAGHDFPTYSFALTNTKVYAMVQTANDTWAIPICNKAYYEEKLYDIAIKRDVGRVSFRIDNVEKVEVPGYCGIDNRFRITGSTGGCSPSLDSAKNITSAQSLIYCGKFFTPGKGFCQSARYQMCENNISFASGCRCQYQTNPSSAPFIYEAEVGLIEVFTMGRTNRCDGDSSSSEHRNWWECKPDCCAGPIAQNSAAPP